ncbi:MAG: hypothetical protein NW204_05255 [Xanthomonadaceae bacterium]|nr:hypothetical protein [Xanthomonadaceae bacterium]
MATLAEGRLAVFEDRLIHFDVAAIRHHHGAIRNPVEQLEGEGK